MYFYQLGGKCISWVREYKTMVTDEVHRWYYFFIWPESKDKLDELATAKCSTYERSEVSINVLDLAFSVIGEEVKTDLYCKPTDCNQFPDFNSEHPIHNRKADCV